MHALRNGAATHTEWSAGSFANWAAGCGAEMTGPESLSSLPASTTVIAHSCCGCPASAWKWACSPGAATSTSAKRKALSDARETAAKAALYLSALWPRLTSSDPAGVQTSWQDNHQKSDAQMRKFNCWNISIVQQYGYFKERRLRSAANEKHSRSRLGAPQSTC